jgi:hypothetical protein
MSATAFPGGAAPEALGGYGMNAWPGTTDERRTPHPEVD